MLPALPSHDDADKLYWSAYRSGDHSAFRLLFERYADVLVKYGVTVEAERELVKDAVQDLFLHLWQIRETIGEVRSVKAYLFVSVRRRIIEKQRAKGKVVSLEPLLAATEISLPAHPVEETLIDRETILLRNRRLRSLLDTLPPRQKEALFLRFYEGLDLDEIATIMELNNQVTRNTIYRALQFLRRHAVNIPILLYLFS